MGMLDEDGGRAFALTPLRDGLRSDAREQHPEDSALFDRAMVSASDTEADAVSKGYDFARFSTIVDVGGGRGVLLAAILARNPDAKGILFDQAHVVDKAEEVLRSRGVLERCRTVGGSSSKRFPTVATRTS
jgi:hypothetical protein